MSGYLNPPYSQGDGTKFQWSNCGCAVCTDLIDKATCGALRIPAWKIRAASGDTVGGITNTKLVDTMWALTKDTKWPVQLAFRVVYRSQVDDLIDAGRNFGGMISAAVTHNTRFETNDYMGLHEIYSADHDPGFYRNDDPGTTAAGYMWWPSDLYYRAMEAAGGGKCLLLVAPDTEGVDVKCVMPGHIRGTPSVTGTGKGALVVGRTYSTVKTVNGGPWKRADGGVSYGWWKLGDGRYAAGERMARA